MLSDSGASAARNYPGGITVDFSDEGSGIDPETGGDSRCVSEQLLKCCLLYTSRAVHYIVVYRGVYIEIQIKPLFEEGWGEIDHSILYPRRKGNAMLTEFSELLNRLAGMGDEMGSFYRRLQVVPDEKF